MYGDQFGECNCGYWGLRGLEDEYLSRADNFITFSVGQKLKRDGTDAVAEFCCLNA